MTDREEKIRQRAYGIWEKEGYPHGHDQDHWHRAAREVESTTPAQPEMIPQAATAANPEPVAKPAAKSRKAAESIAPVDTAPKTKARVAAPRKRTTKS
jgi:hypothetical protein